MTKEDFKTNLLKTIQEITADSIDKTLFFTVYPVKENNVTYNSSDDIVRLWILTNKNVENRKFTVDEVVDFLSMPNYRYPLWVKVFLSESTNKEIIFELKVSMRFRTPTQLKHIETGHPPFIYEV
ncbi:hypothetical protein ACFSJW_14430 [Flavobacterium artemisiae]|uniref:Uncharacterized protein n=1 Tax=Flavobacterium artemisiae TaxID=2126556 RepID=A0ABW4HGB3_9FLAO